MIKSSRLDITVKQGDTYDMAITFPFSLVGCRVHQQVRVSSANDPILDADSDNGSIVINEQTAQWNSIPLTMNPGKYLHDIEITHTDGNVFTYLEGSFVVTSQITRDS